MARVRVPIAFTTLDRWLIGLAALAAGEAALVLWLSQSLVAPPRPRVTESRGPTIGLAVRSDAGVVRVVRAVGPARDAGLRAGDRIIGIDGRPAASPSDVLDRVRAAAAGQTLKIEARRGAAGQGESVVLADVDVIVRDVSPADHGLPYDDVTFRNADGLVLRGWYLPPPAEGVGRAPAIAYGHGNTADRRQWLPVAVAVHDAGFAQMLFDFTGRGDSDGDVITLGAHEAGDLRAALDALAARPEVDPLRLALGGRSMGAVAALVEAAEDARVKALILDSPFADLTTLVDHTIAGYHIPAFPLRPVLLAVAGWRAHYSPAAIRPIEAIRRVKAPILLFHGGADTLIPFEEARAFQAAASGPFTLVRLEGIDHDTPRPDSYQDRIVAFLTHAMPPSWRSP